MVRARTVAGDLALGERLLDELEPRVRVGQFMGGPAGRVRSIPRSSAT